MSRKKISSVILWNNFYDCAWAMSYDTKIPVKTELLKEHVEKVKKNKMNALVYFSPYFYYVHDPDVYLNELKKIKEEFGLDGIYFDGIYSHDWLLAYELMRRTRQLFPSGDIIYHATGIPNNGGPPLERYDIMIPAIDTYATATLRGEGIISDEPYWKYPAAISSQYGKSNCIGFIKANKWEIPPEAVPLIHLLHNGRARYEPDAAMYSTVYMPILMQLNELWKKEGHRPDFYEKFYRPKAKELIEPELKKINPAWDIDKF